MRVWLREERLALGSAVSTERYLVMSKFRAKAVLIDHEGLRRADYLAVAAYEGGVDLHAARVNHGAGYAAVGVGVKNGSCHNGERGDGDELYPRRIRDTFGCGGTDTEACVGARALAHRDRIEVAIVETSLRHEVADHWRETRGMLRRAKILKTFEGFALGTQIH